MKYFTAFGIFLHYWLNVFFYWSLKVLGIAKPIDVRIHQAANKFGLTPEQVTTILEKNYNQRKPKKNADPYGKRYFNNKSRNKSA